MYFSGCTQIDPPSLVKFQATCFYFQLTVRESWSGIVAEEEDVAQNSSSWFLETADQLQDAFGDIVGSIGAAFGLANVTESVENQDQSDDDQDNSELDEKDDHEIDKDDQEIDKDDRQIDKNGGKKGDDDKKKKMMDMDPMAEHDPSLHPLPKGFLEKWYKEHPKAKRWNDDDAWSEPRPESRRRWN